MLPMFNDNYYFCIRHFKYVKTRANNNDNYCKQLWKNFS